MMQPNTGPQVITWLDTQPTVSIWTTSISLFEIQFGLSIMPDGKKRRVLEKRFHQVLHEGIAQHILDFNTSAAMAAAEVAARLKTNGFPIEIRDVLIAGIVTARRGTLATRNTKHFANTGTPIINPWEDHTP